MRIRTCLISMFLTLVLPLVCIAALDSSVEATLEGIVGQQKVLRRWTNGSRHFYLNDQWDTRWSVSDPRVYMYEEYLSVQVLGYGELEDDSGGVWIEFEEGAIGRQRVEIRGSADPRDLAGVLPDVLNCIFIDPADATPYGYYAQEAASGLVHVALCNHLPTSSETILLSATGDEHTGHLCPLCFRPVVTIEDIDLEIALGTEMANVYKAQNRVSTDHELADRVQAVGSDVLEAWPFSLAGYRYVFLVSDSPLPVARGCPGGTVIVNRGLLEAFPDDEDLSAVLAHEIAHVELRHGLEMLKASQANAKWGALAGALAGAAVGAGADDVGVGLAVGASLVALSQLASQMSVAGYELDQVIEADIMAEAFNQANRRGPELYERILRSLAYYANSHFAPSETDPIAGPPAYGKRLEAHHNLTLHWPEAVGFEGMNDDGIVLATIAPRLIADTAYHEMELAEDDFGDDVMMLQLVRHSFLVVDIHAGRELSVPCELKDLALWVLDSGGKSRKIRYDNKIDPMVFPNRDRAVHFISKGVGLGAGQIDNLNANFSAVDKWKRSDRDGGS